MVKKTNILDYDFNDNPVVGFYYNLKDKKIKLYFDDVHDTGNNSVLVIENWNEAKSRLNNGIDTVKEYEDINSHLGIIYLIFSCYKENDIITINAETLDDRYIDIKFHNANVYITHEHEMNRLCQSKNALETSFENRDVSAFYYNDEKRIMELELSDTAPLNSIGMSCNQKERLVIKKWKEARSRIHEKSNSPIKYTCFWQANMGILCRISSYRLCCGIVEMTAETIDGGLIDLSFKDTD